MAQDPAGSDEARSSPSDQPAFEGDLGAAVLELDHVYTSLAHPRRRYLCYTLLEDDEWTLTELAVKIAAWENDVSEDAVTDEQRDRVYVSLFHSHVPKLVEEGIVTFDAETEQITAASNAKQVLAALHGVGANLDARQEDHARGRENDER